MRFRTAIGLFFGTIVIGVQAEEPSHPAFQEGTNFGKINTGTVSEGVKQFNPQHVPNFTTSNPPETNYHAGNLSDSAAHMASTSETAKTTRQNYQNRPPGMVRKQEAWLQKGITLEQSDNPVQSLTGHYTDCKATTPVVSPQYQVLTCDEFVGGEEKMCSIGQIVEVDAKHTYQCQSTRLSEKLSCQKISHTKIEEQIEKTSSCKPNSIIATGGMGFMPTSVHCDIDSPTITMDFVCGWRQNTYTRKVQMNHAGRLDFSDCKPERRDGRTVGWLPYTLFCDKSERCNFFLGFSYDSMTLSFTRPRMIATVRKVPVDSWDNQCAALEGRIR